MDRLPPEFYSHFELPSDESPHVMGRREHLALFWQEHGGRIELGAFALWVALVGVEQYKSRKKKN